jgi:hypothetical protein
MGASDATTRASHDRNLTVKSSHTDIPLFQPDLNRDR